jgi:hypothetical protein
MSDTHTVRRQGLLMAFQSFAEKELGGGSMPKGMEQSFAQLLQIKPSAWSMIKTGARPVGDKLARQFEVALGKPSGWLDEVQAEQGVSPAEQHLMALALAASRRTNADGRRRLRQLLKEFG